MYARICKKCNNSFLSGNYNDDICIYCNGDMPRLTYYELEKKKK